jgi:ABC-2 type transport system ATP-binding protein
MTHEIVIQTENLTKRFQEQTAVDNLSLDVYHGEVFGFLGPNGAGKTTTIAMLLALMKPTSGHAIVMGHDVQQEPVAALRSVGAMIEAPAFYPYLSGYNNLRVLGLIDNVSPARIQAVLEMVDLAQAAQKRVGTYSQGMKQRLAIAATLLAEPQVIILDEPTNGLDPAGTVEVRTLIRTLAEGGHTIFLCSHLLYEVEQLCHRVAIVKEGRMLAQGDVNDLLQRGRGVQVRIAGNGDNAEQAVLLMQHLPWINDIERQDDLLIIDAPGERTPEINALLARNDIPVAEIRTREESLEEFFLEITQQKG